MAVAGPARNIKPKCEAQSLAFEALKFGLTFLLPLLLTSITAKLFGQVIGLLFFFNLVATAVLFIAAWIATYPGQPSAAEPHAGQTQQQ
jgi:membrane protein